MPSGQVILDSQAWLWKEKREKKQQLLGLTSVFTNLRARSICLDISERVLETTEQSQYIGHQHGGSLSCSLGDLPPPQGHFRVKTNQFCQPATPGSLSLYVTALVSWMVEDSFMWFPWADNHGGALAWSFLGACVSQG